MRGSNQERLNNMLQQLLDNCYRCAQEQPNCTSWNLRRYSCDTCISSMYYDGGTDDYSCVKAAYLYTLKYGPAFITEIISFLADSHIIENFNRQHLRVISLGGGMGTDYLAINKYMSNSSLSIAIDYTLYDLSLAWQSVRNLYFHPNMVEYNCDILQNEIDMSDVDIVFINKLYSTLLKNNRSHDFINWLQRQVKKLSPGAIVVFNDINHKNMGRDEFNSYMSPSFSSKVKYYTSGYHEWNYTQLRDLDVFSSTGTTNQYKSLPHMTEVVFFVYTR